MKRTFATTARLFFLPLMLLVFAPDLHGQCQVSASATVNDTAGTVTLTMTNSGTCSLGGFTWQLDDQNSVSGDSCPNGQPQCTYQTSITSCLSDGTHVFHVTGACAFPGPNGSCPGSIGRTDAPFVIDQRPTVNVSASRIAPRRFHITVDYVFRQAPGHAVSVFEAINGQRSQIYDAGQGPFGLSGTRSFDYTFDCDDSVQLIGQVFACNNDVAEGQTTVTMDHTPKAQLSVEKNNTPGQREAVMNVTGGADVDSAFMILDSLDPDTGQVARIWWSNDFFPNAPAIVPQSSMPVRIPISASTRKLLRFSAQNCNKTGTAGASVEPDSCAGCPTQAGPTQAGQPVQLWDGTMTYSERDPIPSDLGEIFTRSYASNNTHDGLFGNGWWSALDSIVFDVTGWDVTTQLVHGLNDDRALFRQSGGAWVQSWPTSRKARATLTGSSGAGFSYRGAGSSVVQLFGANHKVTGWIDLARNRRIAVTYDASSGLPSRIFDEAGTWSCTVTISGGHVTQISVDGRPDLVWNYAYASGHLQSVSLVNATSPWRSYEYSSGGQLATIRDALGNAIEQHSYDSLGRATTSLGSSGDITLFEYLAGQTSDVSTARITHADGSQTTFNQAFIGRDVTTHVDGGCASCGSNDSTYSFDSDGHVLRTQDGRGYIVENTYGASGNLTDVTTALVPSGCDPATDTNQCRLTSTALTTATLAPTTASDTIHYDYEDGNWPDRATRTTRKSVSSGQNVVDKVSYDGVTGQILQHVISGQTGSGLHVETHTTTTNLYDGTEAAAFQPGGPFQSAWLSLPQPVGLRKTMDGPRTDVSDVTTFVYYPIDNSVPSTWRGRIAAVKDAAGNISTFSDYDVFAHALTVTDPNGVKTQSTYDALGRLATSTTKAVSGCDTSADPLCATDLVRQTTYQVTVGPMQSSILPAGGSTVYGYDSRSRVASVSRGPSASDLRERIDYTYDAATGQKNLEKMSAYESGTWVEKRRDSYAYDSRGRLALVTHADATSIAYTYDGANNISSVRDERHTAANTTYAYDPMNRLASVTQALSTAPGGQIVTAYTYDIHGNLISVTDPNGNVTSYVYDDFGRMLSQTSPVTGVTTYAYDPAGDLTSTTDGNGAATTRSYDALGRVSTATSQLPTRDPETITWSYDDTDPAHFGLGRLSSATEPSGATAYRYDRRGLLASEAKTIGGQTFTSAFQYDADGNRSAIHYPSGRNVTWTFDYADRPFSATVSASAGTTTLVSSASYLPFGPVKDIVFGNGTSRHMTYDTRYRATTNQLNGSGDPIVSHQYHYDDSGNITGIDDLVEPAFSRSFGYDDLNRLTAANSGEGLWGQGSYNYDSMGNVRTLSLGARTASFSYDGTTPRLLSVAENNQNRDVIYDGAGNERRVGTDTGMTYTPSNHLARWKDTTYTYDARGVRATTVRPVRIVNFSVAPSSVTGGSTAQGTVTLSSPAPDGGAVVTLTSDHAEASTPANVTVSAGQTAATFTVATAQVSGETTAILTAAFNGLTASTSLTITGSRIDQVQMSQQSVVGGTQATGSIILAAPAPEEGLSLTLRSSDPAVIVPSEMAIRGGARSADFTVSTTPVDRPTTATISVVLDAERHDTTLTVVPPSIASFAFDSRSVRGGSSATATLILDGAASERGITILIESGSRLLDVPASVAVVEGQRSVTFAAAATPVESETPVSVTATLGEQAMRGGLTIEPPVLTDLSVTPPTVVGGDPLSAKPVIDGPAAAGGAAVAISSSDPSLVAAPSGTTISAGTTTATVPLTSNPVAATTPVIVSASRQGVTRSTTVTLQPPPVTLASLTLASSSVVGTNDVVATVTLTGPAPAGGVEVELTSSNQAVVAVPPVLTMPAGTTSATLIVTTSLVTADREVTITALHATTTKTVTLSVLHPSGNYIAALVIEPAFITGGTSASGTVTLALPSSDHGGSDVTLVSSNAALSVPASVKVNPNATTATFTIATSAVTSPVPLVVTASYGGVTQRMNVIVAPENAVTLASLTIVPNRVTGGAPALATVTLNRPAPFGGARVTVEARRRNIVTVPDAVVVPEGASVASFRITTDPLHAAREKSVEIVATYNNNSASATLTVLPTAQATSSRKPDAFCASLVLVPCVTQSTVRAIKPLGGQDDGPPPQSAPTVFEQQYTFYTPELNLMSETTSTSTTATPVTAFDYVWFGGQPLAQIENATGNIAWYFNDHLGTPIRQTDETGRVLWHAEYEPYGTVYAIRRGEGRHQPLRLPGQTAEDGSDLYQNVFRFYRAGWGRYTQDDPVRAVLEARQYSYALDNPLFFKDPKGLFSVDPFCKGCKNPIRERDPQNLFQHVVQETTAFCAYRLQDVDDVGLRDCLRKSCQIGKVHCDIDGIDGPCADPNTYAWSNGYRFFPLNRIWPKREAWICANKAGNFSDEVGGSVIHEWAHGCGYNPDTAIPGIP